MIWFHSHWFIPHGCFLFSPGGRLREQKNEGPKQRETGYKWERQPVWENQGWPNRHQFQKHNHSCLLLFRQVQFNIITKSTVIHTHYECKQCKMRSGKMEITNVNIIREKKCIWLVFVLSCDKLCRSLRCNPPASNSPYDQHLLSLSAVCGI